MMYTQRQDNVVNAMTRDGWRFVAREPEAVVLTKDDGPRRLLAEVYPDGRVYAASVPGLPSPADPLTCGRCGWTGKRRECDLEEWGDSCVDLCPRCEAEVTR